MIRVFAFRVFALPKFRRRVMSRMIYIGQLQAILSSRIDDLVVCSNYSLDLAILINSLLNKAVGTGGGGWVKV